jgi:hypothetical protein
MVEHIFSNSAEVQRSHEDSIQRSADKYEKGNAEAGVQFLDEVGLAKYQGSISSMAKSLERSGAASVKYDERGEAKELIFSPAINANNEIKIDVDYLTINGKDANELLRDSNQQSLDFLAAKLASEHGADSKPLSADAQRKAVDIVAAIFDGNPGRLSELAKNVSLDPDMARNIQSAMTAVLGTPPVRFNVDLDKRKAETKFDEIPAGSLCPSVDEIEVTSSGRVVALNTDSPRSANLAAAMQRAAVRTEQLLSDDIALSQSNLEFRHLAKASDYKDMGALVADSRKFF